MTENSEPLRFVYIDDPATASHWQAALHPHFPEMVFTEISEITNADDIDVALVWNPPPGILQTFPNLKAICNLGAGVNAILADDTVPTDIPLIRLVDPMLTAGMTEYVVHWVLHLHRGFDRMAESQRHHQWRRLDTPDTQGRKVGILGLGQLGVDAAKALVGLGFQSVAGWSRSAKAIDGVESFAGDESFMAFIERTEILVCLLPLTPQTTGILNAETLAALPQGAHVINAARGGHVVEADLLTALDSGHIASAVLDVFDVEPLPEDHRFWDHPSVVVTPHVASLTVPETAAPVLAQNLKDLFAGKPPRDLVDRTLGY